MTANDQDDGAPDEGEEPKRRLPPRDPEKVCGAKTDHGPCQQWKGYGTDHVGVGRCHRHGGSTRNHNTAADRQQVDVRMRTYGAPIDTDPLTALSEEVQRTAGHVAWLGQLVAELLHDGDGYDESISDDGKRVLRSRTGLTQIDAGGKFERPSVWVDMYREERQHLARVCKMAIDVGVDEHHLQVIERQSEWWITLIRRILDDPELGLSGEQQAAVQGVIARNFALVQGGLAV